jgi:hypothetical protein
MSSLYPSFSDLCFSFFLYTRDILELSEDYEWASLLNYHLAFHGKRLADPMSSWSEQDTALKARFLRPKSLHTSQVRQSPRNATSYADQPKAAHDGREICLNWNGNKGCMHTSCQYAHVCITCRGTHPLPKCPRKSGPNNRSSS